MSKPTKSTESHIQSNFECAVELQHESESLEGCGMSWGQNTRDSMREDGYSDEDAFDAMNVFHAQWDKYVQSL